MVIYCLIGLFIRSVALLTSTKLIIGQHVAVIDEGDFFLSGCYGCRLKWTELAKGTLTLITISDTILLHKIKDPGTLQALIFFRFLRVFKEDFYLVTIAACQLRQQFPASHGQIIDAVSIVVAVVVRDTEVTTIATQSVPTLTTLHYLFAWVEELVGGEGTSRALTTLPVVGVSRFVLLHLMSRRTPLCYDIKLRRRNR